MQEYVSQVWVIVTELRLLPRRRFCGEYSLKYLRSTDYSSGIGQLYPWTDKLEYAMQLSSLDFCNAIMTKDFLGVYPDAFAMLISETKTNLHYLNPNSILHQKIQELVDKAYTEKEVETLKRISSTEETPDSAK